MGLAETLKTGGTLAMPYTPRSFEETLEAVQTYQELMKPKTPEVAPVDHINPSHYQAYIDTFQWLDAMSRIPTLREPAVFLGALELQIRKYLDRSGGKDAVLQEQKKAMWYLRYKIAYLENDCVPIRVEDIPEILGEYHPGLQKHKLIAMREIAFSYFSEHSVRDLYDTYFDSLMESLND